jgi:pimeloyl-ACP methyl ester carboxylesterase
VKLRLRRLPFVLVLLTLGGIGAMARLDRPAKDLEKLWAVSPSSFVTIEGGLRVHVRDRGPRDRPAFILVHGTNASLFTWEGWSRELSSDFRVITLDLPGHGLTGPDPEDRYAIADMVRAVGGVADALGVARFSLGGNSLGGHIAMAYALAHPERVDKLILIDSAGLRREEPRPLLLRMAGWPVMGHALSIITPRFAVKRTLKDAYGDPAKVTDPLVDQYLDLLLREGNRRATRLRQSAPPESLDPDRLAALRMPVLILWGSEDRWILPRYGERLHQAIPRSQLVVFEGLGHIPMEEDPATTVRAVRELLSR